MIDTSLFVAEGASLRSFTHTRAVAASPAQVFAAFTQPAELKKFFGVTHNVELAIGGPYEILFGEGDEAIGSNGCQVLSYAPDRMLSFSWNASPDFPEERKLRTWVTILLAPDGDGGCAVELTHCGFGEGGNWDDVYAYFDSAWTRVLDWLIARFA